MVAPQALLSQESTQAPPKQTGKVELWLGVVVAIAILTGIVLRFANLDGQDALAR